MFRELERRMSGSDVIAFYWDEDRRCGELVIDRAGESSTRVLPRDRIADALRHPYLYVPLPAVASFATAA